MKGFKEHINEDFEKFNPKLKKQLTDYIEKEKFVKGKTEKETEKKLKELPMFKNNNFTYTQAKSLAKKLHEEYIPDGELNGLLVSIPDRLRSLKQSKEALTQTGFETSAIDLEISKLEQRLSELKMEAGIPQTKKLPGSRVITTGGANEI